MKNHFHALIYTPKANIDAAMMYIMRQSSLRIGACTNRINKIYGGRYRYTVVTNEKLHATMYKYVFRNPVKAGICERVEEYPYSTLSSQEFVIHEDALLKTLKRDLSFLNTPERSEVAEALKAALHQNRLDQLKGRNTRKPLQLDERS